MSSSRPATVETLLAQQAWVRRIARTLVRDAHEADDLTQDTLAAALRRPPADGSSPRAWLGTVLRNASRKRIRSERRRLRREHAAARPEGTDSTARLVERAEMHERVVRAVLELEEPYRSTVLLRFFEVLRPGAIARRQGVPVETVRTRLKRALPRLRERLAIEFGDDGRQAHRALVLLSAPPAAWGGFLMATGALLMALKSKTVILAAVLMVAGLGTAVWTFSGGGEPSVPEFSKPDAGTTHPELEGRGELTAHGDPEATVVQTAVAGRTFDADSRPVGGVPVELRRKGEGLAYAAVIRTMIDRAFSWPHAEPSESTQRAVTGSDGAYRFDGLVEGVLYEIRAVPEAPATATGRSIVARSGRTIRADLMVLSGAGLKGRVVDPKGRGVRAWLSLRVKPLGVDRAKRGSWYAPFVPTDAAGRFVVPDVPDGELSLSATAPGDRRLSGLTWSAPYPEEILIKLGGEGLGVITGRVVDSAGRPVEGARVWSQGRRAVGSASPPIGGHVTGVATTDSDGRYRIEQLPAIPISLIVHADGYVAAQPWGGVDLPQNEPQVVDVTLTRSAALRGIVRSEDGKPLEGARVIVGAKRNQSTRSARTDAEGRYAIGDLAPGTSDVWVVAAGFWLAGVDDQPLPGGHVLKERGLLVKLEGEGLTFEQDFILRTGLCVAGRVVDRSGAAIEGAEVKAENSRLSNPTTRLTYFEVLSDARGRFVLSGLAPRSDWSLSARKDLARTRADMPLDLTGAMPAELLLRLEQTHGIIGRVVDAEGQPVPAARVTLDGMRPPVRASEHGRFRFDDVMPGDHRLDLTGDRGLLTSATKNVGVLTTDMEAEIEAPSHYVTAGIVVDPEGQPVSSAWIGVHTPLGSARGSVRTDAEGRFVIYGLPVGEFEVSVNNVGLSESLRAGARDVRLVYEAPARQVLKGTVWGPSGRVVAQVDLLVLRGEPPGQTPGGYHSLRGRFEFPLIGRAFRVDVAVVSARDENGRRLNTRPLLLEDVNLAEPLEFHLKSGRSIRGLVVDGSDRGVGGIPVRVTSQSSRDGQIHLAHPSPSTTTDESGAFELVGLLDGKLTVVTDEHPLWLRSQPLIMQAAEEDTRITVQRGGTVGGVVLDPAGRPIPGARVAVGFSRAKGQQSWTWARTGTDGRFLASSIPDGLAVSVRIRADPHAFDLLTDVAVGSNNLVIRGKDAPTIAGELHGPDGKPVANGLVVALRADDPADGAPKIIASATLDGADHHFRLGPLEPGRYRVIARATSGPFLDSEPQLVMAPAKGLVLSLGRGHVLKGRLVGNDVAGFNVTWLAKTAKGLVLRRMARIGSSGVFSLEALSDEEGVLFIHRDGDDRCAEVDHLRPGMDAGAIRLQTGLTIEGRVDQDRSRTRILRPQVWAKRGEGIVAIATADDEGRFVIRGLPRGRYAIGWGAPGSAPVDAAAGAKDVVLRPGK